MHAEHNIPTDQRTRISDVKAGSKVPGITTDTVIEESVCGDCVERWENEGGAA